MHADIIQAQSMMSVCVKALHASTSFPPVLNWGCQITQVDLYNSHITVVVVVVVEVILLWRPCVAAADIIFSSCFFFLLLLLFSSPNLSRRRLDVYHTSTHGVALVRI